MANQAPQANSTENNSRGIRNVRTSDERFTERTGKRLAQVELLSGREGIESKSAANDSEYGSGERPIRAHRKKTVSPFERRKAYESVRQLFQESGEGISDSDIDELRMRKPDTPGFPYFMVMIAVIKDIADVVGNLVVIGIPVTMATSFLMSLILFFWVLGKASGGWWKKKLIRWLWVRLIIMLGLEMIPFVQIIPATTIFILMAHYKERKVVKLFDPGLEQLRHAKVI